MVRTCPTVSPVIGLRAGMSPCRQFASGTPRRFRIAATSAAGLSRCIVPLQSLTAEDAEERRGRGGKIILTSATSALLRALRVNRISLFFALQKAASGRQRDLLRQGIGAAEAVFQEERERNVLL